VTGWIAMMALETSNPPPINRMPDDFFVTYTKVDEEWASWISWWLERVQYKVIFDQWDFRPGHNFVLKMHDAARSARKTIMVLSNAYLEAQYTQPEWAARFASDPTGMQRNLIPVRVGHCEPTGLLKGLVYVDLVGIESELEAVIKLLAGVMDESGRTVPKPHYPLHRTTMHISLNPPSQDQS
jgi:TIR domain